MLELVVDDAVVVVVVVDGVALRDWLVVVVLEFTSTLCFKTIEAVSKALCKLLFLCVCAYVLACA